MVCTTDTSNGFWGDNCSYLYLYPPDLDDDGSPDGDDNCPSLPNGPLLGTCVKTVGDMVVSYRVGNPKDYITCTSNYQCTPTGGTCLKAQIDTDSDGCGDLCECIMDCNNSGAGDAKVNLSDLGVLKDEYSRIDCDDLTPCYSDGNEDGKVNSSDLGLLKNEYGRIDCPACTYAPRFTINGDGTVTDNRTGLVWLRDAFCLEINNDGAGYNWDDAMDNIYFLKDPDCGLSDGSDYGDWRLPTIKEWEAFVCTQYYYPAVCSTSGLSQWSPNDPFINIEMDNYWSSTASFYGSAKFVGLDDGNVGSSYRSYFLWPVRGGQ